jgi:hypothetical protein
VWARNIQQSVSFGWRTPQPPHPHNAPPRLNHQSRWPHNGDLNTFRYHDSFTSIHRRLNAQLFPDAFPWQPSGRARAEAITGGNVDSYATTTHGGHHNPASNFRDPVRSRAGVFARECQPRGRTRSTRSDCPAGRYARSWGTLDRGSEEKRFVVQCDICVCVCVFAHAICTTPG